VTWLKVLNLTLVKFSWNICLDAVFFVSLVHTNLFPSPLFLMYIRSKTRLPPRPKSLWLKATQLKFFLQRVLVRHLNLPLPGQDTKPPLVFFAANGLLSLDRSLPQGAKPKFFSFRGEFPSFPPRTFRCRPPRSVFRIKMIPLSSRFSGPPLLALCDSLSLPSVPTF